VQLCQADFDGTAVSSQPRNYSQVTTTGRFACQAIYDQPSGVVILRAGIFLYQHQEQ
jgi:hypothetical protein